MDAERMDRRKARNAKLPMIVEKTRQRALSIIKLGLKEDAAEIYGECIKIHKEARQVSLAGIPWKEINDAIEARWPKCLERLKRRAWIVSGLKP